MNKNQEMSIKITFWNQQRQSRSIKYGLCMTIIFTIVRFLHDIGNINTFFPKQDWTTAVAWVNHGNSNNVMRNNNSIGNEGQGNQNHTINLSMSSSPPTAGVTLSLSSSNSLPAPATAAADDDGGGGHNDHDDNNNSTTTLSLSSSYHAYWCGHDGFADKMAQCLFDDAIDIYPFTPNHLGHNHSQTDVIVVSYEGPCFGHRARGRTQIPDLFQGRILYVSGESGFTYPLDVRDHIYALTHNPDDGKRNIRSYFGTMYAACIVPPDVQPRFFHPSLKVENSRERYLIYTNSRCLSHREEAFRSLSQIGRGPAYHGGRCMGESDERRPQQSNNTITAVMVDTEIRSKKPKSWRWNYLLFSKYRFALVMENTKQDGYITEKIINAFLAGCIPIYYGTLEIFDIFNPRAFVYYDIENPQDALDRVAYLERNETAYLDMLRKEPIFKNGTQTLEDFFSYRDDLGKGRLKQKIREMMMMKRDKELP